MLLSGAPGRPCPPSFLPPWLFLRTLGRLSTWPPRGELVGLRPGKPEAHPVSGVASACGRRGSPRSAHETPRAGGETGGSWGGRPAVAPGTLRGSARRREGRLRVPLGRCGAGGGLGSPASRRSGVAETTWSSGSHRVPGLWALGRAVGPAVPRWRAAAWPPGRAHVPSPGTQTAISFGN